ncbi:hypothetical protein N7457_000140 [Penicillium paradoxum]|uniref:uncharacterized protein n=1 Tax=Penicillium paradoxum TaxID=176176 RepID=UPI0025472A0A|nr:uncharacterized protein N7457_000140 [Penicillium paradoxum]KAJ5793541.1 hypothetical protein N7457_000140 [Penicillium paradoxum]
MSLTIRGIEREGSSLRASLTRLHASLTRLQLPIQIIFLALASCFVVFAVRGEWLGLWLLGEWIIELLHVVHSGARLVFAGRIANHTTLVLGTVGAVLGTCISADLGTSLDSSDVLVEISSSVGVALVLDFVCRYNFLLLSWNTLGTDLGCTQEKSGENGKGVELHGGDWFGELVNPF